MSDLDLSLKKPHNLHNVIPVTSIDPYINHMWKVPHTLHVDVLPNRVGKRSRTDVGSGNMPERQHSSPAASRTYSDRVLRSGIPKAGLRH